MTGRVKFPDANSSTFTASNLGGWTVQSTAVGVSFIGLFGSSAYIFVAPNDFVAGRIIALLNQWWDAGANTVLDLAVKLGTVIASVSPTTWIAANSQTVTLVGYNFQTGMNITIGSVVYAATVTDIGDATASYNGGDLAPGTYDVVITNTDGTSYILQQSVVLT